MTVTLSIASERSFNPYCPSNHQLSATGVWPFPKCFFWWCFSPRVCAWNVKKKKKNLLSFNGTSAHHYNINLSSLWTFTFLLYFQSNQIHLESKHVKGSSILLHSSRCFIAKTKDLPSREQPPSWRCRTYTEVCSSKVKNKTNTEVSSSLHPCKQAHMV